MKTRMMMLAMPLAVGLAMAQSQTAPPQQQQTTPPQQQQTMPPQQQQQATPPAQQTTTPPTQQATPPDASQADRAAQQTPDTQSKDAAKTKAGTTASGAMAEMKTTNFKGVLVDMGCAGHSSGTASTAPAGAAADQSQSANRAASDSGSDCPVTASSTQFGLKMDDGKTVRFDLVGNQRAQDAIKNEKSWNKELTANKPIHAKVSGVMSGDKLIVSSIH